MYDPRRRDTTRPEGYCLPVFIKQLCGTTRRKAGIYIKRLPPILDYFDVGEHVVSHLCLGRRGEGEAEGESTVMSVMFRYRHWRGLGALFMCSRVGVS